MRVSESCPVCGEVGKVYYEGPENADSQDLDVGKHFCTVDHMVSWLNAKGFDTGSSAEPEGTRAVKNYFAHTGNQGLEVTGCSEAKLVYMNDKYPERGWVVFSENGEDEELCTVYNLENGAVIEHGEKDDIFLTEEEFKTDVCYGELI